MIHQLNIVQPLGSCVLAYLTAAMTPTHAMAFQLWSFSNLLGPYAEGIDGKGFILLD